MDVNRITELVENGLFPNPIAMLIQLIATAILFFFIYKFAYKPVMKMLKARQDLIDKEMTDAKVANENAQNLNIQARDVIVDARKKADTILATAKKDADEKTMMILDGARKEASYKIQKAEDEIDKKLEEAKSELREEIATNSVFIAEKVINSEIDSKRHQDLISEAINEVRS